MTTIAVDYLVIGAGAMGLAFTDALVDHDPTVRVALVDRRHGVGGHWLEAYPFVRLHQSSSFYGVASTVLGGRIQTHGPEAGLQERAGKSTICSYYADVAERLVATDRVELFTGCEYDGDRTFVSRVSGRRYEVPADCRIVDARYLSPDIPAETPPRFAVDGARVVPSGDLPLLEEAPSRYVVAGSGKTATDTCIWLLANGVDPGAITWVRPRDPWMLNRTKIQPDPEIYLGMVADMLTACAAATSLPELFVRLEEVGIMLRIDPSVTPSMAKAPTLGPWELELLRSIEDVVRLGHITSARAGCLELTDGSVEVPRDTVVVHCTADGLRHPDRLPIWQADAITIQPVRAGFPCFGAALIGYVEATRTDDAEKNRLCAPSSFGNSLEDWATMNVLGFRNASAFNSEPDIRDWAHRVTLNPARIPPGHAGSAALDDALARMGAHAEPALARLEALAG
ncbi:NAD(P)-binding protein [Nocardioides mangrovi]|uniref:NAD(P)-binding protein n=1 Tax=Nocardioides mangrovi TaxID=2874580 RepID=A0ABS7UFU3_9ACTN|nr:NAD(P)-binding protein [Nocardioides mangrovi]MBZ5739512.1 NAD(P)-binding protein [Nocardioides mangrovi]